MQSPELNTERREMLVKVVNQAAKEIYSRVDLPRVLKECYLEVTRDTTITLPPFVGELRAVRNCRDKQDIVDLRPRYSLNDWQQKWDKFRLVGEGAINRELLNTAPVSVEYSAADAALSVTLIGETDESNRAVDTVTMTGASVLGTKNFININKIRKNKITENVVKIYDADGVLLSEIYADQFEARYLVVDISEYPDLRDCSEDCYVLELLYKPRLGQLFFDHDEFPVSGQDDLIVLKTLQLLAERNPGEEQRAILMYQKADSLISDEIRDKTGHVTKRLTPTKNKMFGLFPKYL